MQRAFTPSGAKLPCPICGRVKDGDCRILSDGRVFCHTKRDGKLGKASVDNPSYVYLGASEEAQGAGMWKLDAPSMKAPRPNGIRHFDYCFWDGAPCPVQRFRKDSAGGKQVAWCKGGLGGRPQSDVAPYLWEKVGDTKRLFVVRGELKAELLSGKGFTAISLLNQKDEVLVCELQAMQSNGVEVVLVPDCDTADLDKWFRYLSNEVPGVKQLLAPGLPWSNAPADGGLGIEDWIYAKSPSNDEILAVISSIEASGLNSNEKSLVALKAKIKEIVDKYKNPLSQVALIKKEASELGFYLTAAEINSFISDAEYIEPIPYDHTNPQPYQEEPKLWGNLFLYQCSNLIVAPPKVGKSALAIHLFGCMYRGESHCLGQPIHNRCKTLIIIGSDMGISQWHKLLIREGLATVVDGKVHIVPDVILFPKGTKIQLDSQGRKTIEGLVLNNPNAMVLIDTYRSVTASLGLAEGTREAAIPVELLFESLAEIKSRPTILIAHHSKLAGGSNAANSSAGGYAIPSAFDQTINMNWLQPNSIGVQSDKRILLHSSGRGSQDQAICIELTGTDPNPVRWISHGNAEDLIRKDLLFKAREAMSPPRVKVLDQCLTFYKNTGKGIQAQAIMDFMQCTQQAASHHLKGLVKAGFLIKTGQSCSGYRYYPYNAERLDEGSSSSSTSTSADWGGRSDRREATDSPSDLPDSVSYKSPSLVPQKQEPCPPLETEFSTGFNHSPKTLGMTSVQKVQKATKGEKASETLGMTGVQKVQKGISSSSSSSLKEPIPTSFLAGSSSNAPALYANDSENDAETLKPQLEQRVQAFRQGEWESGWTICDSKNPHSLRIRTERNRSVFQLANQRWGIDIRPEASTSFSKTDAGAVALDTSSNGLEGGSRALERPPSAVQVEEEEEFF